MQRTRMIVRRLRQFSRWWQLVIVTDLRRFERGAARKRGRQNERQMFDQLRGVRRRSASCGVSMTTMLASLRGEDALRPLLSVAGGIRQKHGVFTKRTETGLCIATAVAKASEWH